MYRIGFERYVKRNSPLIQLGQVNSFSNDEDVNLTEVRWKGGVQLIQIKFNDQTDTLLRFEKIDIDDEQYKKT